MPEFSLPTQSNPSSLPVGTGTCTRISPSLQNTASTGKRKPPFLRGAGSWFVTLDTHQSSPARIHPPRLTGQHQQPPSRKPLEGLLMQPCGFTCLPYRLCSPGKIFSPAGSILHELLFPALFLQPPEVVPVVRSPHRDEAKVEGNLSPSQPWATDHVHLGTGVDEHRAWARANAVTISAGWSPSSLPAVLLPRSRQRRRRASKCWQH